VNSHRDMPVDSESRPGRPRLLRGPDAMVVLVAMLAGIFVGMTSFTFSLLARLDGSCASCAPRTQATESRIDRAREIPRNPRESH
jgi:hypothetical protein